MARIKSRPDALPAFAVGAGLLLVGFLTTGGFDGSVSISAGNTWTEIAVVLVGAVVLGTLLALGPQAPRWGLPAVVLFATLTALTALSITWSVAPDDSWQAANLTLAYLMTFAAGAALARLFPDRWRSLLGAVAAVAVLLSAYALLAKVFPGSLAIADTEGRLQAPLGYWNATGAMAGMGLAPCLWGFARPDGPRFLRALTVPAVAVLGAVVVLSFSRTAVVIAVVTVIAWLTLAPGRLRSTLNLAVAALGAAIICAWSLAHAPLSTDGASLAARTTAGHTFGVVILLVVLAEAAAGLVAAQAVDRIVLGERLRRRVGISLIGLAALALVVGLAAVAASARGLTGEISHAWHTLVSVNAVVGESASRITNFGSSRPLYWSEGISVGEHALLKGVGALGFAIARTQYTKSFETVGHAHSYVIQTFADLGLLGLGANLFLLLAWARAAVRPLAPRAGWGQLPAARSWERSGLIALLLVVVAFGLSSTFDWTWYFPAMTLPALLAAGWLAGRGPLLMAGERTPRRGPVLARPAVLAGCSLLALVSVVCGWLIWQPLRSADDASAVFTAPNRGAALGDARSAVAADPLALQPHFVLSQLYAGEGNLSAARSQLLTAVRLQPRNYESWLQLGLFDLHDGRARVALPALERAYALNPTVLVTLENLNLARTQLGRPGG